MSTVINNISLRPEAVALFLELWEDRDNWSGMPLVELYDAASRADLTNLKRAGLLSTVEDDGCTFALFTSEGEAFASKRAGYCHDCGPDCRLTLSSRGSRCIFDGNNH